MRRIAIRSLLFDRGKLIAALLGVALATTLAFVQIGLYRGFQVSSSAVIDHFGGDLWVIPTGLEVLDVAPVLAIFLPSPIVRPMPTQLSIPLPQFFRPRDQSPAPRP